MKNKNLIIAAAVMCFGLVAFAVPAKVQAAAPCSIDIINQANGEIAKAQQEFDAAKAMEAAALANWNAIKASGATELEKTVAANAYTNAQNVSHAYLDKLNNAKAFLANIQGRADCETTVEQNLAALNSLTNVEALKMDADSAQALAVGVANRIADVQRQIVGYQQQLATSPSLQPVIDQLNASLVALQNEYAAKKAVADQKLAVYQQAQAAATGAVYSRAIIDRSVDRIFRRGEFITYEEKRQQEKEAFAEKMARENKCD